jgi:hypothetical protein
MRVTGGAKLTRQLRALPRKQRAHIVKALNKSADEGVRVARTLVPVDSGELKDGIHKKSQDAGMTVSVEAAPATKEAQIKAKAVEFGRTKGNRGATDPRPYLRRTQAYLAKRVKGRIKRAIKKAAKEVVAK